MANQSRNCSYPSFCADNCGFYGNPASSNLCSKCYKDYLMKPSNELGNSILSADKLGEEGRGFSSSSSNIGTGVRSANRCSHCKKKVGLTGFKCRCGKMFCSLHRYSEEHNCVFDYKGAGQDAIARANPVVKADKVDKI